jgi:O-antigen/teichoic acid export membrane protein
MTESEASGIRQLTTHGLWYLIAGAAQTLIYVLALPLVTRLLDAREYGNIALALVVMQALVAVAPLGLTSVVAWDIYDGRPDGLERATRLVWATAGVAAVVVSLAALTGPYWVQVFSNVSYGGVFALAVWMVLPLTVQAACLAVLQAQRRPRSYVTSTLISTVGGQALGIAFLALWSTPSTYLIGLLIGSTLAALAAAAMIPLRPRRPASWRIVTASIRHGGPAVPHLLAFMVLAVADRVLVEHYLGLREAARYQIAYMLGALAMSIVYGLNTAWAPLVYGASEERRWPVLSATTARLAALMAAVTATIAFAAPIVLRVLAPRSYDPVALSGVASIVAASVMFDLAYLSGVHVLFRSKRTGPLLFIMPGAAAANIALNVILIPRWHLTGAAIATLAGYAIAGIACRLAAHRVARVLWDRTREFRALLGSAAAVGAALILPTSGTALIVRIIACGLVAVFTVRAVTRALVRNRPIA